MSVTALTTTPVTSLATTTTAATSCTPGTALCCTQLYTQEYTIIILCSAYKRFSICLFFYLFLKTKVLMPRWKF